MNQGTITLQLNKEQKVIISPEVNISNCSTLSNASLSFTNNNDKITLSTDFFYQDIDRLKILLKKALNNNLKLDDSITDDIGFTYNEYLNSIDNPLAKSTLRFKIIQQNTINYWIGDSYNLWDEEYTSWIYNDNNGAVIFKITPCYPYFYCNKKEVTNYITYKQWIKTYKPYFITALSRKTAQDWLACAENIIKILECNFERLRQEY